MSEPGTCLRMWHQWPPPPPRLVDTKPKSSSTLDLWQQKRFTEENHKSLLQLLPGSLRKEFMRPSPTVMQRCVEKYFMGGGFSLCLHSGRSWDQASPTPTVISQTRHEQKVFRKTQIQPVVCPTGEALRKAELLSPLSPWDHEKEPYNDSCYFKPLNLFLKVLFHLSIVSNAQLSGTKSNVVVAPKPVGSVPG